MSFNLVFMEDENGQDGPSYNEKGEILIHDEQNDTCSYVPLSKELISMFPQLQGLDEPMATFDNPGKQKAHWTYEATIMLINKYKDYQSYFADAIHKNVEVWDKIASEFRDDGYSFCGNQCENRWKYVRGKYLKKKDNGGPGSTGDEFYQFEYYREMDDILGMKPNVVPRYLASSESSPISKYLSKRTSQPPKVRSNRTSPSVSRKSSSTANANDECSSSSSQPSGEAANFVSIDLTSTLSSHASRRDKPNEQSSRDPLDTRGLNISFNDDETTPPPTRPTKEARRHEENIQRQDKYHADMMEAQRESMNMFKDMMSQMLDCFRKD